MRLSRRQTYSLLAIGGLAAAFAALAIRGSAPREPEPIELSGAELRWLEAHGPLRFAPDPNFAPIESFDADGRYRGLVADYFRLIERRLGVPIEIVRYPTWDDVLEAARSGEVDGITAAQVTPERSLYLDYSPPIIDIPNVLISRRETRGPLALEDLAGRRVAVTQGNALDEYIGDRYPEIVLQREPDDLSCLRQVSFGRADATVVNLAIASDLIESHGITNLEVVGDSGRSNALAIATRRQLPLLAGIMSRGLAAVTDAERDEIRRRWIRLEWSGSRLGRKLAVLLTVALGAMALAALLFMTWNAVLRRRITRATAELRAELVERRRAEEALHASQRKLALHLEQTLFFVIEWDLDFRIRDWNPAAERVFGWSRAEALGRAGHELLLHPGQWPRVQGIWRDLVAGRGGRHSVNENLTRDGRTLTCEWFNSTLVDASGRPTGVMSIGQDVTDRVRTAETLAQSQRLESLAILAGGIAHDFNNLLTGILGNASMAADDERVPAELREALRDAESAAQRARGLTQQLLTFARGGAPVRQLVDPEPTVREAARFAMSGSSSRCEIDAEPDLWPCHVDPHQLAQAVQNLALNAAEAMGGGGVVTVELDNAQLGADDGAAVSPGPYLRLRVSDRGPGIAEELRSRIFDPFFSTKPGGSGLGLAVCHSIAVRHGGGIRALRRPGGGTTLELLMPARPEGRAESGPTSREAPALRARVLVLDDEEVLRRLALRLLDHLGCEAEAVADGEQALRSFQAARERGRPFDVVLLDLTVPGGLGGVETLARLRGIDPAVRAVVSSGYSTDPVLAAPREHGFQARLPKPFGPADLRGALQAALSGDPPAPG